jgi:hypothetical protein
MTFISTSGHGYLKITPKQLKKALDLGYEPTTFSFMNKSSVLLEEDLDAGAYLKTLYPNDEDRQQAWKKIKTVYQNDINRNIYGIIPTTSEEFDEKVKIYTLSTENIGKTMKTIFNEEYKILNVYKSKGYIYRNKDSNIYYMPIHNIKEIA